MLTQTAAGRTYDYSHSVGRGSQSGMGFAQPVAAALGQDDMVYILNRGSESIGNMPWNRIGIGARVSQVTIGTQPGVGAGGVPVFSFPSPPLRAR